MYGWDDNCNFQYFTRHGLTSSGNKLCCWFSKEMSRVRPFLDFFRERTVWFIPSRIHGTAWHGLTSLVNELHSSFPKEVWQYRDFFRERTVWFIPSRIHGLTSLVNELHSSFPKEVWQYRDFFRERTVWFIPSRIHGTTWLLYGNELHTSFHEVVRPCQTVLWLLQGMNLSVFPRISQAMPGEILVITFYHPNRTGVSQLFFY